MYETGNARFQQQLSQFTPSEYIHSRVTALFSGAVTFAALDSLNQTIAIAQRHSLSRAVLYEIVLQSYLFLGFPRMLTAMDVLNAAWSDIEQPSQLAPISAKEGQQWHDSGIKLCEQVYQQNYPALKRRVEGLSPEVFRWMIIEGYGKVLSRPGIGIIDRELAIVAALMIEQREPQLHSHIKGALNVGSDPRLVRMVVDDIGDAAGDGYEMAIQILNRIGGQ
jgi:4-carboxymuconolactone decarboxylase